MDEEVLARRVAELLREQNHLSAGRYVDTAAIARHVGVSIDWVREHAAELGAVRIGDGPKGALRFEVRKVEEALERRRLRPPRQVPASQPRGRRLMGEVDLLPLPNEARR